MLSSDVRRAVRHAVAAAGWPPGADPGLRPTGIPGQYGVSVALGLSGQPRETARALAAAFAAAPWIAEVEVTGPGYLTITVTTAALAAVADRIAAAGPGCADSDALAGVTVPAPPPGDPLAAATWDEARAALAARLTARLAGAAGATATDPGRPFPNPTTSAVGPGGTRPRSARSGPEPDAGPRRRGDLAPAAKGEPDGGSPDIAAAVAFAGRDAVTFALASVLPDRPVQVEPEIIARHVAANPAYAVRYAHARAASGVRWAQASQRDEPAPCPPADPGESVLLDALSWLPERVAVAARRGRPDEFARYLTGLAGVTVDVLSSSRHPGTAAAPGSDRLALAKAARAGLAAGLGLLEVSAPERL